MPPLGEERDEIWDVQTTAFPDFADYQVKTNRIIPVVAIIKKR
mgnify:CR=1 FL=1